VTIDAAHTQTEHAEDLPGRYARYLVIAKGSRTKLRDQLKPSREDFPPQVRSEIRRIRSPRETTVKTVHAVTSLTTGQATTAHLTKPIKDHWAVETVHHIRDTTITEMPPSC